MSANNEKLKALKLTMDKIDKDFGKGSVMMMNERGVVTQEVVSTGSIGLDTALGIGGLPRGRVVEYMDQNHLVKPLSLHMLSPKRRKKVACVPSLMPNMLSIVTMRKS